MDKLFWQQEFTARGVPSDAVDIDFDVLLAPMTTFRIGGPARVVVNPLTEQAAVAVWSIAHERSMPLITLGGGTNVLIADRGIDGVVVDLSRGFAFLEEQPDDSGSSLWRVGAGCGTSKVVRRAIVRGLRGPEVLAGVPGSVGGALIMNAGGHTGEIGSMVRRIRIVDQGELRWLQHEDVGFAYRQTAFPADSIVLACELELAPGNSEEIKDEVVTLQQRRRGTQPVDRPNAGSIFKNPPDDYAGRLIERASCKGWSVGGAEVSHLHANFIVNQGGATADDVLRLVERVRDAVRTSSGVELELEVKLLGNFAGEVGA